MPARPSPISNEPFNWLFLDMNSFFASAEQHLNPELRGRLVGVIPLESDSTCLIAASVEAKAAGLKMGTGVREARQRFPEAVLIKARPEVYVRLHHRIRDSIERWAPIHQAYSIDEWAIRLGKGQRDPASARELGRQIKAQVYSDFSPALKCSVGIAPTRLLAKIACELHKPDGLTLLPTDDLPERLDGMALDDLCGIGHGMAKRLERHGIHTIRQLWAISRREAVRIWGSVTGGHWWDGFHGHDEPEVRTRKSSMGHDNVLAPEFRTDAGMRGILTRLTCRLGLRLRTEGYAAGGMSLNIHYVGGGYFGTSMDLPYVQDTRSLLDALWRLFEERPRTGAVPLKIGVTVHGLERATQVSGHLFEAADREVELSRAMDKITQRWGMNSIYFGSLHHYRHHMDEKIAFGKIPSLLTLSDPERPSH